MEKIYKFTLVFLIIFFINDVYSRDSKITILSDYINNIQTISSNFIQTNSNGENLSGIIKIKKPGLLRLEYIEPFNKMIISNGKEIALINKENTSITYYNIDQLPMKIFLSKSFFLDEYRVVKYNETQKTIEVELTDKIEENRGSIKFIFQDSPLLLKKWVIKDIQGFETQMFLSNTIINGKIEEENFIINDPRKLPFGNTR